MYRIGLGLDVELIRYYIHKKSKSFRQSVNPIADISEHIENTCRESVISNMKDIIFQESINKIHSDNQHQLVPYGVLIAGKKVIIPQSTIMFVANSISNRDLYPRFGEKKFTDYLYNMFNYTLGIISVCLENDDNETIRRNKTSDLTYDCIKHSGNYGRQTSTFKYYKLPPFWIISPMITSLFFGMGRGNIAMMRKIDYDLIDKHLFSKVHPEEVEKIINESNQKEAMKIYKSITKPFFKYSINKHIGYVPGSDIQIRIIDELIKKGLYNVFNPFALTNYWEKYSHHYGFRTLTYRVLKDNSKGWEKYKVEVKP